MMNVRSVAATIREWLDDPERFGVYIDDFTMLADGTLHADSRMLDATDEALRGLPSTGSGPRSDKGPGNPNQDPDPPRNGRPDAP